MKEATEGLYQTLSNQFTGMSQRADIMTASMKLAKVGVMDFHDAILLITGTLNAYGMTSDQAEAVAAKFFTTIQLGRVRGQELSAVMGQVAPIAAELGIGLDQVNSAMKRLLRELGSIREVVNVYPRKQGQRTPHQQTVLTRTNELQDRLLSILALPRPEERILG